MAYNERVSILKPFKECILKKKEASLDYPTPKGCFYPSQLDMCARMCAYVYLGAKRDSSQTSVTKILRNEGGNLVHWYLQSILLDIPEIKFEKEVRLYDKALKIKGRCDGVFYFQEKKYVLEIKSLEIEKWEKLTKIEPYNKTQANIGAGVLGAEGVLFWYFAIDFKHLPKEFYMPFDRNRWNETKARIKEILQIIERGKLPKREKDFCHFCDFSLTCNNSYSN